MKPLALLLCTGLILPTAAFAQPARIDDRVIVPGVRVGRWHLDRTLDDYMREHGFAVRLLVMAGLPPAADAVFDYVTYSWDALPVTVMTFAGRRRVEFLQTGFLMHTAHRYATDAGVRFLTRRARIVEVYGRPTAETRPHPLEIRMIYDHRGIAFGLDMATRAHTIYIFRPGTADRFWHLI
jgi:hypothetical protein